MNNISECIATLGFIGAGNMAGALLRGTVGRGLIAPDRACACDIDPEKLTALSAELKIATFPDPAEVLRRADVVVIAVKPRQIAPLLGSNRMKIEPRHLIISIAAGIPIASISRALPPGARVIRVMPNTPSLIGEGAAAIARGEHATPADAAAALALFGAVGLAIEVAETQLDAVTALSGSGPAYVFRIIELMQEAGEQMGLAPADARALTLQTVLGAARLAAQSDVPPAELRRRVTSPGGTTAAALQAMEERGLPGAFKAALLRAQARAAEMAAEAL